MHQGDPNWADVVPLPQDDGDQPLAQIAYTDEYAEAMSYLRALMAREEYSERALEITERITEMNPAHYTVWLYRAKIIFALNLDLRSEIKYVNDTALRHEKNYQIWHHRQLVIDRLDDPSGETEFIARMFEKDAKNYHVWSYRQWLVKRFRFWDHEPRYTAELDYLDWLLKKDVRNNSAWNHRFFLVFGDNRPETPSPEVVQRELRFAEEAIYLAPQNPSPWNYIRGLLFRMKMPLDAIQHLCEYYAPLSKPDSITSSHALDVFVDICASKPDGKENAIQALDLLSQRFDPIRRNYWNHRKSLLQKVAVPV